MEKAITWEELKAYETAFDADRANRVAMGAATTNGVVKAATNQEVYRRDRHQYSISLEQGKVTNQKQSGRCWMFAALNTMRYTVMKKLNLPPLSCPRTTPCSTTSWRSPTTFWRAS